MNLIEFSEILQQPGQVQKNQAEAIEKIIKEFPYFQAAHAIYLSALKKQNSFKYNQALKKTAALTTDRSILFEFITSNLFVIENYVSTDTETVPATEETTETTATEDISGNEQKTPTNTEATGEHPKESDTDKTLPVGKPLPFKSDDTFSFNEWLNLSGYKPVERKPEENKQNQEPDLIDRFIAANPKIKPAKHTEITDYSEQSAKENEHLMTETLALVYLEQKKYEKAKMAFRILSLKYPEKSSFFANRIEEVEKLQNKKS